MSKAGKKGGAAAQSAAAAAPSNGSLISDRKGLTIFMPAPIDWDFVPYPRRPMLRRNIGLINPLHSSILSHIFPYILLVFGR
jgi:hypothetical protein